MKVVDFISYKLLKLVEIFPAFAFQVGELGRLSVSMKILEKELSNTDKYKVSRF